MKKLKPGWPSPTCPYCGLGSFLVTGREIYPHYPKLACMPFWLCRPCHAYVGCHPKSTAPLGRLANAELRLWRRRAHAAFDPIWKIGRITRSAAYMWLAGELGIAPEDTHIALFDVERCRSVVAICNEYRQRKKETLCPSPKLSLPQA